MYRKHPQTPLSPRARTMTPLALLHAAGAAATTGTAAAAAQQWPSLDEAAKVPSSKKIHKVLNGLGRDPPSPSPDDGCQIIRAVMPRALSLPPPPPPRRPGSRSPPPRRSLANHQSGIPDGYYRGFSPGSQNACFAFALLQLGTACDIRKLSAADASKFKERAMGAAAWARQLLGMPAGSMLYADSSALVPQELGLPAFRVDVFTGNGSAVHGDVQAENVLLVYHDANHYEPLWAGEGRPGSPGQIYVHNDATVLKLRVQRWDPLESTASNSRAQQPLPAAAHARAHMHGPSLPAPPQVRALIPTWGRGLFMVVRQGKVGGSRMRAGRVGMCVLPIAVFVPALWPGGPSLLACGWPAAGGKFSGILEFASSLPASLRGFIGRFKRRK